MKVQFTRDNRVIISGLPYELSDTDKEEIINSITTSLKNWDYQDYF